LMTRQWQMITCASSEGLIRWLGRTPDIGKASLTKGRPDTVRSEEHPTTVRRNRAPARQPAPAVRVVCGEGVGCGSGDGGAVVDGGSTGAVVIGAVGRGWLGGRDATLCAVRVGVGRLVPDAVPRTCETYQTLGEAETTAKVDRRRHVGALRRAWRGCGHGGGPLGVVSADTVIAYAHP
jgi:hypothetical protein